MLWKIAKMVVFSALVTGCAVGPNFKPPGPPDIKSYTATPLPAQTAVSAVAGGSAQRIELGKEIHGQWWALFQSEPLDRLIQLGMADSPTAAAAQAALRQARENVRAQYGTTWFPSVNGNLSATRERTTTAAFGQTGGGSAIFNLYHASVSVSYLLDIFGGSRRELEALQAQLDYQLFELQGTYLALTANIATTAFQEASLRAQVEATHEIIKDQQEAYELIKRQFELGGISKVDLLSQQTQLAQTQASLPPLEKALSQTRHQLTVLVGRFPAEAQDLPNFDLSSMTLPRNLPVSLPSTLVRQRPDIRASEALLHTASARIGVATADLLPRITLTGSYGWEANDTSELFKSDSLAWNLGAGLLQPIFNGGALRAKRRAAMAAFDQALAVYRQTVLQAFANVADALRALETDARTLRAQAEAEKAARETLTLAKKQYQYGAASYLSLLNAQRQYQQARISLIKAQATRFSDTAALFQALGGGWWYQVAEMGNEKAGSKPR